METVEDIENVVDKFLKNSVVDRGWRILDSHYNHVRNICISILSTKYKLGHPGGSFVQSIVNNDLMGSFGCADNINSKYIKLYVELLYNV